MIHFFLGLWMAIVSASFAQTSDVYERPTRGGTEGGIPEIRMSSKKAYSGSYFVAALGQGALDPRRPTHVVVAGLGEPSGLLFQLSASARAQKYAEVFPEHQVVMIAVNELGPGENRRKLERWGFQVLEEAQRSLDVSALVNELNLFDAIASLDIFSHSNEVNGAKLDWEFIGPDETRLRRLNRRFTQDAFVMFHGCNSGWQLAPSYSRLWRAPVAGSFTGTHFERLHSLLQFYPWDELTAPEGNFLDDNPLSYSQTRACSGGSCLRMKPDAHAYDGMWGTKEDGISFYKFFCVGVDQERCDRALATSLLGFIGTKDLTPASSPEDFKSVLYEFMCPIHKEKNWRERCIASTDRALALNKETYSPFFGRSVQCDFNSCRLSQDGEPTTTYINEVRAYLRGYQLIHTP